MVHHQRRSWRAWSVCLSGAQLWVHASVDRPGVPLQVPYWQSRIVQGCRKRGKPVIVATNMLESMIQNPTPTRAEVSDIAIAVREGADAVMLSGESAYGKFPFKAVSVMSTVAKRTERAMLSYQASPAPPTPHPNSLQWPWWTELTACMEQGTRRYGSEEAEPIDWIVPPGRTTGEPGVMSTPGLSEMFAYHATTMANTIRTSLLVFTRMVSHPTLPWPGTPSCQPPSGPDLQLVHSSAKQGWSSCEGAASAQPRPLTAVRVSCRATCQRC